MFEARDLEVLVWLCHDVNDVAIAMVLMQHFVLNLLEEFFGDFIAWDYRDE